MRAKNRTQILTATAVFLLLGAVSGCSSTNHETALKQPIKPAQWGGNQIVFTMEESTGMDHDLRKIDSDGEDEGGVTLYGGDDSHAAWSPDGNRVAFASIKKDEETNSIDKAVYVADKDGNNVKRLTKASLFADDPTWSPDGKTVAFSGRNNPNGMSDIYTIKLDGTGLMRLTNLPLNDIHPSWSPYGDRIVFSSERKTNSGPQSSSLSQWDLYTVKTDGSDVRKLTGDKSMNESLPEWSPDGQWIAFRSRNASKQKLSWVHPNGSGSKSITLKELPAGLTWSPDARKVVLGGRDDLHILDIYESKPLLQILKLDQVSFLNDARGSKTFPTWAS